MKQDTTQKMILDWQNKKPLVEGLPPDLVFPGYGGYSLSNLSASICRWLGAPLQRLPLDPVYHQPFSDRYRHILLFVCDGLGLNMLQKTMLGEGEIFNSNEKEELFNDAYLYPLTSVTPSTTSAALTSLWTGALPYEHGIVGYEIWLKEYGMITNMIRQTAASFSGDWGGLARAGFDAEQFLPIKSISALLSEQQVQTHFYIDSHLVQSGLTVMHMPGAKIHAFSSLNDARLSLQSAFNQTESQPTFSVVYWPLIDTLAHQYGPDDGRVGLEIEAYMRNLLFLLRFMKKKKVKDTLLLMTADHGLITTPLSDHFDLAYHPEFVSTLVMMPSGENRLPYFYVRAGREKGFVELFNQMWGSDFTLFKTTDLVDAGLFGLGHEHPLLETRLGDYIAIARGKAYLWWKMEKNPLLGRHGGLNPDEMLVPLMCWNPDNG